MVSLEIIIKYIYMGLNLKQWTKVEKMSLVFKISIDKIQMVLHINLLHA